MTTSDGYRFETQSARDQPAGRAGGRRRQPVAGLRARPARSRPTASRSRTAATLLRFEGRVKVTLPPRAAARRGVLTVRGAAGARWSGPAAPRSPRSAAPRRRAGPGPAARQPACRSRSPPTARGRADQQVATFTGNVDAVQGELVLSADQLACLLRGDGEDEPPAGRRSGSIRRIEAEGNVFVSSPRETAQGDAASTTSPAAQLTLEGSVVLTQRRQRDPRRAPRDRSGQRPLAACSPRCRAPPAASRRSACARCSCRRQSRRARRPAPAGAPAEPRRPAATE